MSNELATYPQMSLGSTSPASSTRRSRPSSTRIRDPELVKQWLGPRGYVMESIAGTSFRRRLPLRPQDRPR